MLTQALEHAKTDTTDQDVKSGEAAFRPRARIIKTLGEELITNEFIALQELVKNAYDADAHHVTITFEEPIVPGRGAIVVRDDGNGMTLETLRTAWMEPATLSKVSHKKSEGGRRVTGEKGIGRFAAARVASALDLTSTARSSSQRIHAHFDWGIFEDTSKYLDEIRCRWTEEAALDMPAGTELRLVRLKDDWSRGEKDDRGIGFRQLRAALSRLVSPLAKTDFEIEIVAPPAFSEFGGVITPPPFLGKPHYWMAGSVDANGVIDAVYQALDGDVEAVLEKGERPHVNLPNQRQPRCGPFGFEFRVWDRSRDELDEYARRQGILLRDVRRDLDAASGIGIYRDGFRVMLPENADWLGLDLRRVQNPTMRISNNQIVGLVSIGRDSNPGLIDQTNRQGLVDSAELADFKIAVRDALSRLESRRDKTRRPVPEVLTRPAGFLADINVREIRDYVAAKYADDVELKRLVDITDRNVAQGITKVKTVLARYRRLATLGQLVDVILHDGRTPVAAISNEAALARRELDRAREAQVSLDQMSVKLTPRLETIAVQTKVLTALFRRISPFSGRKRGRPQTTTVEQVIRDAVGLAGQSLKDAGIIVRLPESNTAVTVDPAEMQMLIFNLLDNAIHWLQRVPQDRRRIEVEVERGVNELYVTIADDGPGVDEADQAHIFEPYFTTREDGVGLGLTIAGELAAEYDGSLELVEGPLRGAAFRVTLRRRIGEES